MSIENLQLKVNSLSGMLVYSIELSNEENELVISTTSWQPGTYIVSLMNNEKLVESKKITVLK